VIVPECDLDGSNSTGETLEKPIEYIFVINTFRKLDTTIASFSIFAINE